MAASRSGQKGRGRYDLCSRHALRRPEFRALTGLEGGKLDARALARLIDRIHTRHKAFYGYDMREHSRRDRQPAPGGHGRAARTAAEKREFARGTCKRCGARETRKSGFRRRGFVATPVYDRDRLPVELDSPGPAIVEQMDTTTVVPPRAKLRNDKFGYLHMAVEPLHTRNTGMASKRPPGSRRASRRVDPIKAEVMARYLARDGRRDGRDAMRTAFSPNIKERADCSTAVFDAQGR